MPYHSKPKKSGAKKVSGPVTKKINGVWHHKMPNGKWMKGQAHK
jgi:hypothetical protein